MDSSIPSGEGKDTADDTHEEGKPLGGPPTLVNPFGEDNLGRRCVCQRDQRNKSTKKAQDMDDENHALQFRQDRTANGVDPDREGG